MLDSYRADVRLLLNDPNSEVYTDANLNNYINKGRRQTALVTQCVRDLGSYTIPSNSVPPFEIDFASITPPTASAQSGLDFVISLRNGSVVEPLVGIYNKIEFRSYEYFQTFLNGKTPASLPFKPVAAIYKQGQSGRLYVGTSQLLPLTFSFDCIWLPIQLADDTTVEAIPVPWKEAVEYYAAAWALMDSQRQADAEKMIQRWEMRVQWAQIGTSGVRLADIYPAFPGGGNVQAQSQAQGA